MVTAAVAQLVVMAEEKEEPNSSGVVDDCDTRRDATNDMTSISISGSNSGSNSGETNDDDAWCYC